MWKKNKKKKHKNELFIYCNESEAFHIIANIKWSAYVICKITDN